MSFVEQKYFGRRRIIVLSPQRAASMFSILSGHPWILGPFAIYATDLRTARQVYELVLAQHEHQALGATLLESGHEIGWVNMAYQGRYGK